MIDDSKEVLVIMGQFIAKGLIESRDVEGEEHWQLSLKGYVEAEKAMAKLLPEEQALALLLADLIIRERRQE